MKKPNSITSHAEFFYLLSFPTIDQLSALTQRYSQNERETSEGKGETGRRNKISYELIRLIKRLNIEYEENVKYAWEE